MGRTATLLVGSILASVLLAEGGLRLSGMVPTRLLHSATAEEYARIPGLWQPGQDFVSRQSRWLPYRVHTNALGLRGRETSLAPRGPRVLCIGDSFTFGDFVDDEQTLPAQLEKRLGGVEVLNGGVGGTTISDQRVFLERLLALRPGAVVLTFYENDLEDLLADPPLHVRFAQNRAWKSGWRGAVYRGVRDTALFNAMLRAGAVRRAAAASAGDAHPVTSPDALVVRYAAAVGELRDRLAERGVALVFLAFPAAETVAGVRSDGTIAAVVRAVAALGIDVVDLTAVLRGAGAGVGALFFVPRDGHARPLAYAIAADALAPAVRRVLGDAAPG